MMIARRERERERERGLLKEKRSVYLTRKLHSENGAKIYKHTVLGAFISYGEYNVK